MENLSEKTSVKETRMVVGKSGVGTVSTIGEALERCKGIEGPVRITILSGVYRERLAIYQTT